jgi:hypothetical protein
MSRPIAALDLSRLRVRPLAERRSLTQVTDILLDPATTPDPLEPAAAAVVEQCAQHILDARARGASVILMYGAHLLRNGAAPLLGRMMQRGWLTHLATNGAGSIHDWEYAFLGRSTESVRENVATGTFGTWDETGRFLNLALLAGALEGLGYGQAIGRMIHEDELRLPEAEALAALIRQHPDDPLTAARAELLGVMRRHAIAGESVAVPHRWKHASILGQAWTMNVPLTVHPGIGYDIIANHPLFNGAAIGRAAGIDFARMAGAVEGLDGGVVLAAGSAIMAPQVFEKTLSCVHNLRLQDQREIVQGHTIVVVDLQDGGHWDWRQGEPPKSHPAYYLRFCKSFARMGGTMHYACCDHATFIHHVLRHLEAMSAEAGGAPPARQSG